MTRPALLYVLCFAMYAAGCIGGWTARGIYADDQAHSPEACARRLHIAYDKADGATERLAAFKRCVTLNHNVRVGGGQRARGELGSR